MWTFKDLLKGSSQKGPLSKQIRHTIRAAKQSCDFLEAFVYSGHYILYLLLGFFVCLGFFFLFLMSVSFIRLSLLRSPLGHQVPQYYLAHTGSLILSKVLNTRLQDP